MKSVRTAHAVWRLMRKPYGDAVDRSPLHETEKEAGFPSNLLMQIFTIRIGTPEWKYLKFALNLDEKEIDSLFTPPPLIRRVSNTEDGDVHRLAFLLAELS